MTRASSWNAKNKRNTFTASVHIYTKARAGRVRKNGDKISWTAKWQSKYTSSIVHLANKSKVICRCRSRSSRLNSPCHSLITLCHVLRICLFSLATLFYLICIYYTHNWKYGSSRFIFNLLKRKHHQFHFSRFRPPSLCFGINIWYVSLVPTYRNIILWGKKKTDNIKWKCVPSIQFRTSKLYARMDKVVHFSYSKLLEEDWISSLSSSCIEQWDLWERHSSKDKRRMCSEIERDMVPRGYYIKHWRI